MTRALTNYEVALKAEAKKVIRSFQRYTPDQSATLRSRTGRPSRDAIDGGRFYYIHPDVDGICFPTRGQAAAYALSR